MSVKSNTENGSEIHGPPGDHENIKSRRINVQKSEISNSSGLWDSLQGRSGGRWSTGIRVLDHRGPCLGGDGIHPKGYGEWLVQTSHWVQCRDSVERADYVSSVWLEGDCSGRASTSVEKWDCSWNMEWKDDREGFHSCPVRVCRLECEPLKTMTGSFSFN